MQTIKAIFGATVSTFTCGIYLMVIYGFANVITTRRFGSFFVWENHPLVILVGIISFIVAFILGVGYFAFNNQQWSLISSSLPFALKFMLIGMGIGILIGFIYGVIKTPNEPVSVFVCVWASSILGVFIGFCIKLDELLDRMYDEALRLEKIKGEQSAGDCYVVTVTVKADSKEEILMALREWRVSSQYLGASSGCSPGGAQIELFSALGDEVSERWQLVAP